METLERWPKLADEATAAGVTLRVYGTGAIMEPPRDPYEDNCDVMLSVGQLRELAKMATWAADRLDARPSVAEIVVPYKRTDLD